MLTHFDPDNIHIGGVDTHVQSLSKYLSKDIELHMISTERTSKKRSIKRNGIRYHILSSLLVPKIITGITYEPYKLIKEVNKINPDLVHVQLPGFPYGMAGLKLSGSYPVVITVHTLITSDKLSRLILIQKI